MEDDGEVWEDVEPQQKYRLCTTAVYRKSPNTIAWFWNVSEPCC